MKPGHIVLIVDDEPAIRCLVAKVLSARGFTPLEARNGLEAVQLFGFHHSNIVVVITDVNMPVMGGLEAIDRIRELSPAARVVVMTGGANHVNRPRCHLLPKPFTPTQLVECVEAALA